MRPIVPSLRASATSSAPSTEAAAGPGIRAAPRLERHGGRGPGAACRRCRSPCEADPQGARLSPQAPAQRRRLLARPGTRLRCPVDRLGDPGIRGGPPRTGPPGVSLPGRSSPARRQLPLLEALCDDAGLGHFPGAPGARPAPVSASLVLSAHGRASHGVDHHDRQRAARRRHDQHECRLARAAARGAGRHRHADGLAAGRGRAHRRVRADGGAAQPTSSSSPAASAARRRRHPRGDGRSVRSAAGRGRRARRPAPPAFPADPEYAARWANLPGGARPLENPLGGAPGFVVANVYVLPGLPAEMKAMFETVTPELETERPITSWRRVYETTEARIVGVLEAMGDRYPGVLVGSYPKFHVDGATVEVVVKSRTRPPSRRLWPGSSTHSKRRRVSRTRPGSAGCPSRPT